MKHVGSRHRKSGLPRITTARTTHRVMVGVAAILIAYVVGVFAQGVDEPVEETQTVSQAKPLDIPIDSDVTREKADTARMLAERREREARKVARQKARRIRLREERQAEIAEAQAAAAEAEAHVHEPTPTPTPTPTPSPTPTPVPSLSAVKQYALDKVGSEQFACLDQLWIRESNWQWNATNPSSGAYGIPQALPGDKMASAGSDWQTNPYTQIDWGISYINERYGTPCGAWSAFQSQGWY